MTMPTVERLTRAIVASWSADTSYLPSLWTEDKPSTGQCAVTALVVQDYLGGTVWNGSVGDLSHYWNQLLDGTRLDLTAAQFPNGFEIHNARERPVDLQPSTVRRYMRLLERVRYWLTDRCLCCALGFHRWCSGSSCGCTYPLCRGRR